MTLKQYYKHLKYRFLFFFLWLYITIKKFIYRILYILNNEYK